LGRGSARSTAFGENTPFYSNKHYTARAVFAFSQAFYARSLQLPTWLITPNTVLLKRFVRNKSEPWRDEVQLLDANPKTALVRFPDGRECTVSVSDLAPLSDTSENEPCDVPETTTENRTSDTETVQSETRQNGHAGHDATETNQTVDLLDQPAPSLRRSTRIRRPLIVLEIMCPINVLLCPLERLSYRTLNLAGRIVVNV